MGPVVAGSLALIAAAYGLEGWLERRDRRRRMAELAYQAAHSPLTRARKPRRPKGAP